MNVEWWWGNLLRVWGYIRIILRWNLRRQLVRIGDGMNWLSSVTNGGQALPVLNLRVPLPGKQTCSCKYWVKQKQPSAGKTVIMTEIRTLHILIRNCSSNITPHSVGMTAAKSTADHFLHSLILFRPTFIYVLVCILKQFILVPFYSTVSLYRCLQFRFAVCRLLCCRVTKRPCSESVAVVLAYSED
jgi:hypothetical protein